VFTLTEIAPLIELYERTMIMDEKTRIAAATVRYRKAADVLRSIIGFNPNAHASVAADYGGLATLLLVKTQLSKVEYI
jgi:hypothetical protein